jgi:uncharacterized membrane protein YeaQ/YmgE (transglycosylase-associated protein family)
MSPIVILLLVIAIGAVVGVGAMRLNRPGWLSRQIAGGRRGEVTSALVGIAGAFVGFHIAELAVLGTIVLLIAALIGALVVVWGWRELRL